MARRQTAPLTLPPSHPGPAPNSGRELEWCLGRASSLTHVSDSTRARWLESSRRFREATGQGGRAGRTGQDEALCPEEALSPRSSQDPVHGDSKDEAWHLGKVWQHDLGKCVDAPPTLACWRHTAHASAETDKGGQDDRRAVTVDALPVRGKREPLPRPRPPNLSPQACPTAAAAPQA